LQKPADPGQDRESVSLKIPMTGAGFVQCLLAEDAEGGLSWHFHKPLPANTRSFGSVCEYEIPCRADMVQQAGSTRTILGWVNRLLMKVIVFPVTDPFFGAAGEFLASRWEAAKRPYQIRWMQPEDFAKKEASLLDDWGVAAARRRANAAVCSRDLQHSTYWLWRYSQRFVYQSLGPIRQTSDCI
jgi:hypothetical protein